MKFDHVQHERDPLERLISVLLPVLVNTTPSPSVRHTQGRKRRRITGERLRQPVKQWVQPKVECFWDATTETDGIVKLVGVRVHTRCVVLNHRVRGVCTTAVCMEGEIQRVNDIS